MAAATKVTPRICVEASTVAAKRMMKRRSILPVETPYADATSGSNVAKSSGRRIRKSAQDDDQGDEDDDPDVGRGDAEDVAEERGFDVAREGPVRGNDRDAKGEAGRRHDADSGISADPTAVADPVNQNAGE